MNTKRKKKNKYQPIENNELLTGLIVLNIVLIEFRDTKKVFTVITRMNLGTECVNT